MRTRLIVVGVLAAVGAVASVAQAEPRDKAAADALFRAARDEFDQGKFESACAKFEESNRLDPAPGTALNLAVCQEKIGRIASAWEGYRGVSEQLRDERVAFAVARSSELEARLPWLTLRLSTRTPEGARVFRDQVELLAPSLGVALPVDPGQHVIVVRVTGHEDASFTLSIAEGERKDLELRAGAAKPAPRVVNRPAPPVTVRRVETSSEPSRTWAWVAGGVGVAGITTSLATGWMAMSRKDTVQQHCADKRCDDEGLSAASEGKTLTTVSTVAGIAGVACMGVGTWLFLRPADRKGQETSVGLTVLPGGGYVGMGRRF